MPTPTSATQTTAVDILQQNSHNLNGLQNFQIKDHFQQKILSQQQQHKQQQQHFLNNNSQHLNNSENIKSFSSSYMLSNRQRIKPDLSN